MQCNSNQIKSELPSIVEYQECVTQKLMPFVLPFLQNIDIHTFGYRKFLLDGRSFGFCTNEKWNLFYKNNLLQLNIQSYEKEVELASQKGKYSCFRLGKPDPKDLLCRNLYKLDIWNSLCIYKKESDYVEGFYFATSKENIEFINFCLNNIPIFEDYINYFKKKLLAASDMHIIDKIALPTISKKSFQNSTHSSDSISFIDKIESKKITLYKGITPITISKRELECLYHVAKGRSMKETAQFLCISPRTVEEYLNNVKEKTGAHNKSELINFLSDNAIKLNNIYRYGPI